jgi:hypothetical protein
MVALLLLWLTALLAFFPLIFRKWPHIYQAEAQDA